MDPTMATVTGLNGACPRTRPTRPIFVSSHSSEVPVAELLRARKPTPVLILAFAVILKGNLGMGLPLSQSGYGHAVNYNNPG